LTSPASGSSYNERNRFPNQLKDTQDAENRVEVANALVVQCQAELAQATERAADARQQLVELKEARDSLAALARLALAHIDGDCPVCGQPHDEQLTAARLNEMTANAASPVPTASSEVAEAAEALRAAESTFTAARAVLTNMERQDLDRSNLLDEVTRTAGLLGLDGPTADIADQCRARIEALQAGIDQAATLRREGELLAAGLARASESEHALELEAELPTLEAEIASLERQLRLRDAAGDDARRLHEALRRLSETLVSSELEIIEPLLQRIYASVDPHPSFRAVRFLTDTVRGRGQLRTTLDDQVHNLSDVDPAIVLSSSQLNVLAVVTFTAMNLSATALPLELAALDDPLQSLDNVNLLGLADLFRRARNERQLIVSTHDDRLASLLERKLRPVGGSQRTSVLRFDGWEPRGPSVAVYEVPSDEAVPRLRAVG
jgi:exonuclease SbcC